LALSLALLATLVPASRAAYEGASDEAVAKARKFMENRSRAEGVMAFVYPTTTLTSFKPTQVFKEIKNNRGDVIKGWFVVRYRYEWKGVLENGYTDLDFYFNGAGRLQELQVSKDSATTGTPFDLTGAVIDAAKDALKKKVEDVRDADLKAILTNLLRETNAKSVLTVLLILDQK